ncbi:RNA polymerase sigma factor [Actinomycetospora atypica]|uniref:RNA polymerase sigma factor n=1 Tax=Actinomycetospora atypica TaxID=1290095 RepID=A0ABV9YJS6_9PSEU
MSGPRQTKVQELHGATDSDLLQKWNAGDADGLGVLVARHHGWVLNLVRYVSYGEHDVEAVAQEVWLDVMRGAGSFRGEGSVRAWLETIVRRRIVTTWRARGARPQVLVGEVPEGRWANDEGAARQVELREDLRGLLARLPDDQRQAIWCGDVLGMPVDEVAAAFGVAVGTIKSRCSRGRRRLRIVLAGE